MTSLAPRPRSASPPAPDAALARVEELAAMIGGTPLLDIRFSCRGRPRRIFAKYEQRGFTGSVKDRMALWIIRHAYRTGELRPGDTIAEATSGNTGIAFAALGRALGHPVRIYMPDWMSRERVLLMQALGAEIVPVSREQGGFRASIAMADDHAARCGRVFLPHQFANPANVVAHEATTGPEIESQLASIGLSAHAFVAGVGTGGTVMGVGRYLNRCRDTGCVSCAAAANGADFSRLREPCQRPHANGVASCGRRAVRIHPLEPAESPTLRTGCKSGSHRIQGISDEFVPSIVKFDELDPVIDVHDGDAIIMAQALARSGLAVGISSGANFLGALQLAEEMGPDAVVVTILPDSNKKYLSTDLYHNEPLCEGYLSPHVSDIRWRAIPCPPAPPAPCAAP